MSADAKTGKLAIEFSINSAGRVTDMRLVSSSGDASLDRPAWDAIRLSDPVPSLPSGFTGSFVKFRFRFYYNPGLAELDEGSQHLNGESGEHARLKHKLKESELPKYPDSALASKIDGVVRLEADVGPDGKVKTVKVLEGDSTLAEASAVAVRAWKFHAAKMNGRAMAEMVRIKMEFRLEGERVRAEVVWPE
jgi:TonB family protein